ncbi:unnamed protein product [Rhodiola kirilowii]
MTPFQAVYGRPPPSILEFVPDNCIVDRVATYLQPREDILRQLTANLERAQNRMRQSANRHRLEKSFAVGEWVFIRLQPYRQNSVRNQKTSKLAKRFFGPFEITARIGPVAYKLKLPDTARIHDVFHVSLLRKCPNPLLADTWSLPDVFIGGHPLQTPMDILAFRNVKNHLGTWDNEVLVHWTGQPSSDATWERTSTLREEYPEFDLADKVIFDEGGNVTALCAVRDCKGKATGPQELERLCGSAARSASVRVRKKSSRYPAGTYVP